MRRGLKSVSVLPAVILLMTIRRFPDEEGTEMAHISSERVGADKSIRRFPDEEGTEIRTRCAILGLSALRSEDSPMRRGLKLGWQQGRGPHRQTRSEDSPMRRGLK